jgi:hypothetical protein
MKRHKSKENGKCNEFTKGYETIWLENKTLLQWYIKNKCFMCIEYSKLKFYRFYFRIALL